jgi:hypothetical protein
MTQGACHTVEGYEGNTAQMHWRLEVTLLDPQLLCPRVG